MSTTILNAIITDATLGVSRGFILDSYIFLDFGGIQQGFGGYALGGMPFQESRLSNGSQQLIGEWVRYVLSVADVEEWSKLKGRTVRVEVENEGIGQNIIGIGHIVKDRWFYPKQVFASLKESDEA